MLLLIFYMRGDYCMKSKKVVIDGRLYTVVSEDEYVAMVDKGLLFDDTCVQCGNYVYPGYNNFKEDKVCAFKEDYWIHYTIPTTDEDKTKYSTKNIIDFNSKDIKSLKDHIELVDKIKSEQNISLNNMKDSLTLPINEADDPELKLIKKALNAKHVDGEAYKSKFPSNSDYNNDMRALKNPSSNSISFFKAKRILNSFDIEMELVIRDKEDAVNPMGKEFKEVLTEED